MPTEQATLHRLGLVEDSARIVAAYVSHNSVGAADLSKLIVDVHNALRGLGTDSPVQDVVELVPAVPVKKSVTRDYIICLDDGKKFKSMRRHLAQLGMTPDEYRAKWKLPHDYPMVAPNYSESRSALAKAAGLGRKSEPEPVKRGRRRAGAVKVAAE